MSHWHHGHRRMREALREYAQAMWAGRAGGDDEGERSGGWGRGGWGRGGWGRGGRALGHGDLRILVLALIAEKPRHGYDIIRAIEEKFAGGYAPSPGAIYPLLTMLEEEDLIAASTEGAKKLFTLTPAGQAWLKDNEALVNGVLTRVDLAASAYSSQSAPDTVWEAWKTLKQAMNMPRAWPADEAERIRMVLERAARDIVTPPKA